MGISIRLRLTLTTLAVLLIGMALAATLAWLSVEQLFLATQRDNLLAQAQLTASALQGAPLPSTPAEAYLQTANVQPGIHTRLLGEQGAVVVSLPLTAEGVPVQVPVAENAGLVSPEQLLGRAEIQVALRGNPASAVRRVPSADNRRVLYAAAPVFSDDGSAIGIVYLATPLPPAGLPSNITLQLIAAIVVAVLLAGIAGVFLSSRIARPLEGLSRAASAVAAGDLNQQVPISSDIREVHNLGEAFNRMTANLRQSEQVKNTFIADVTHELRTPLTVIKGTIETLEDGALDDAGGRGPLLTSMQHETDRLIRLVNDLLVLTRADAGALNLKLTAIDLGEIARARCENLSRLANQRQVRLNVEVHQPAEVQADPDRLSQVLDNLLDNAVRHSPDGSGINITIQPEGHEISCAVSDQGPGISTQHLPFIFERFYRVDTSRGRHSGGSGLGLAIVRSLVMAQGGRVSAESIEGQGTTITFWLPSAQNCPTTA
jgi:signal transduction histidine kinase